MANESLRSVAQGLAALEHDPEHLAKLILAEIESSPDRMRDALIEMLPTLAAEVLRTMRNATISEARSRDRKPRSGHKNKSAKVAGIRSWFAQWLDDSLHTDNGWKRIRDTTRDDWLFAAYERAQHVAAETIRMQQCEAIAELFQKYDVATADQLPEDAVQQVFSMQAGG